MSLFTLMNCFQVLVLQIDVFGSGRWSYWSRVWLEALVFYDSSSIPHCTWSLNFCCVSGPPCIRNFEEWPSLLGSFQGKGRRERNVFSLFFSFCCDGAPESDGHVLALHASLVWLHARQPATSSDFFDTSLHAQGQYQLSYVRYASIVKFLFVTPCSILVEFYCRDVLKKIHSQHNSTLKNQSCSKFDEIYIAIKPSNEERIYI